jgi:uncharacterized protein (TIGR00297 family)
LSDLLVRTAVGALLATGITIFAELRHALTRSGAIAAAALGTVCAAAGWDWAGLLVAFFLTGTLLSRFGEGRKAANTRGIAEKGGARDASQVLANGGVFGVLALASILTGQSLLIIPAIGAIAASTSDTWATEVGTLYSGSAWSILSLRPVQAGTSGGITFKGTMAAVAGAVFIAMLSTALALPVSSGAAALAGGIGGSLIDSVLGATIQSRRWCAPCGRETERTVHTCGGMTEHRRGMKWVDNDGVNLLGSLSGAALGALCLL